MNRRRYWPAAAGAAFALLAAAALATRGGGAAEAVPETAPETVTRTAAARTRGGEIWGADYFPDVTLTTHDGRRVRFFDLIEGKVVALNFIYTTCPDACPMETARMIEVHRLLGDRVGRDVFFYSITIDPERDTPEVLRSYVETWGIGPGWTFLTGREEDIKNLRRKLGVYSDVYPGEDELDHNLSLVIGNQATGRWMKRSPYENPYVLADQLGNWLHGWKRASTADRDYADAPEVRQISTGENLFRTRCASCHTIGSGDVLEAAERRIGPDLLDVHRQRDRAWLERWLKEPDVMLEEGDPLAAALLAQYQGIPMPNLRLTDTDVGKLLGFMEQESDRIHRLRAAEAERHRRHAGHEGHGGHEGHEGHADHAAHGAAH